MTRRGLFYWVPGRGIWGADPHPERMPGGLETIQKLTSGLNAPGFDLFGAFVLSKEQHHHPDAQNETTQQQDFIQVA